MVETQVELAGLAIDQITSLLVGHQVRIKDSELGRKRNSTLVVAKVFPPTQEGVKQMGLICYLVPAEGIPSVPVWQGETVTILD